jgi:hypothetical protein
MFIINSLQHAFIAAMLGVLVLAHPGDAPDKQKCSKPEAVVDPTYPAGQVWTYKTRNGESSSTLTILRIESLPRVGVIVHVRVDDVHFKNCTGGPSPTTIQHSPFAKAAIDKSVTGLLRTTQDVPDFESGYRDWIAHCGGVYTIGVAEMVDVNDRTFNAGLGCRSDYRARS